MTRGEQVPEIDPSVGLYVRLYEQYGYSPKSLGWNNGKQFLRFHQLTSDWDLSGARILDVGCGFGDFLIYLDLIKAKNFEYTGIDIVEPFIKEGTARRVGDSVKFVLGDFNELEMNQRFDFAVASGTFNLKLPSINGYDYIRNSMEKMFLLVDKAISIDFISDRAETQHDHNFNSSPEKILSMAYSFSRNVVLKNTYFPFEFSITIYKDDSFSSSTTTYRQTERQLNWLVKDLP